MAQVPIRVDDFRSKLTGGGARSNMFSVDVTFPGYAGGDTEITSFMCRPIVQNSASPKPPLLV